MITEPIRLDADGFDINTGLLYGAYRSYDAVFGKRYWAAPHSKGLLFKSAII